MQKDPNATLDFKVDWAAPKSYANPDGPWLADGETIAASTWTFTPAGLTVTDESHTGTAATVWLSSGTLGTRYTATNRITTSQGRQDERSFPVDIRNR